MARLTELWNFWTGNNLYDCFNKLLKGNWRKDRSLTDLNNEMCVKLIKDNVFTGME